MSICFVTLFFLLLDYDPERIIIPFFVLWQAPAFLFPCVVLFNIYRNRIENDDNFQRVGAQNDKDSFEKRLRALEKT